MDSLTQLTLGAAVGEATLGRKIGHRAILWGAIAGTLPDLDVFVPLGDAVADFTYHRSASHSLFVLALVTPLMAWLACRIHPRLAELRRQWMLMFYLVFATHVLLDSFTAYGTQIFWPLWTMPMTWSTLFIIDPAYTLPLLVGVIAALVMTRENNRGHLVNRFGLVASTLYLGWTIVAKTLVETRFEAALRAQSIEYEGLFTVPSPFNSVLWRAVVRTDGRYYEAFYSLFDGDAEIRFTPHTSRDELLAGLEEHWPAQRLRWFSKGFYAVAERDGKVVVSDLRMGVEPSYVFSFAVADISNPHPRPIKPIQLENSWQPGALMRVWRRIWDPAVGIDARTDAT